MFNYTITQNESQTATKQSWEAHGYILSIVTLESGEIRRMLDNPMNSPDLFIDDFGHDKDTITVNWSALGDKSPDQANEYAEKLAAAAKVAKQFQQIIDMM